MVQPQQIAYKATLLGLHVLHHHIHGSKLNQLHFDGVKSMQYWSLGVILIMASITLHGFIAYAIPLDCLSQVE